MARVCSIHTSTTLVHLHVDSYSSAIPFFVCLHLYSWAGRGVIDVPLQKVAEFLMRTENNITWDKYLVVSIS